MGSYPSPFCAYVTPSCVSKAFTRDSMSSRMGSHVIDISASWILDFPPAALGILFPRIESRANRD